MQQKPLEKRGHELKESNQSYMVKFGGRRGKRGDEIIL